MSITGIVPLLYVADADATLGFWRDTLGFEVVSDTAKDGDFYWAHLKSGPAGVMINTVHGGQPKTTRLPDDFGCVLYLNAEDVHALCAELRAKGVEVADPEPQEYGLDQLWLRDPDGYQLCITSPTDLSRRS